MFHPYWAVGETEFEVGWDWKLAPKKLSVAVAIIGKRVSKKYNLSSVNSCERFTLLRRFPETILVATRVVRSRLSILEED